MTDLLGKLEITLASGMLSEESQEVGTRLFNRLNSPVRVVLLGMPGSGKSQLLNFLVQQEIIPPGISLPTLEVIHGKQMHVAVAFADGSVQQLQSFDINEIKALEPATVRVTVDLPILNEISLLEVVSVGDTAAQSQAIAWACERADIVLWCSQGFSEQEQLLWASVPDAIKDHSFFVMTKADELSDQDQLVARIEASKDAVSDEFHSLIPIATLQAITARQNENEQALTASGGKAFLATILRQVSLGRQSDSDSAQLFLKRFGVQLDAPYKAADEASKAAPQRSAELSRDAIDFLNERIPELGEIAAAEGDDNTARILDFCADSAGKMADIFIDQISTDPQVLNLQGDLMDASDIMLLMQMETGDSPAADAVSLLLQIRRDLEASLVA